MAGSAGISGAVGGTRRTPKDTDGLRTLARATDLLRLLAEAPAQPQSLAAIVRRGNLHKATAHRLLVALAAEGLVTVTQDGYALGHQTWLLGQAAAVRFDLTDLAAPSLERIAAQTGDVALLSVPTGRHARCIARQEGGHPILPVTLKPGAVRPLGCGAHALALLAAMPDAQVEGVIAREEEREAYPRFTAAYLREKVAQTRSVGVAVSDQDIIRGMTALAVAVLDAWGNPVASLSCAAISEHLAQDRRPEVAALLRAEAAAMELRLRRDRDAA